MQIRPCERLIGVLVCVLFIAFTQAVSAQDNNSGRLAIVGGYLIDGQEGVPIQNSVILVEGDRITHVGTVSDTEIPSDAKVINANGYTVLPGLSEAHAHLFIVGHGIYDEYFPRYQGRWREIMPISARQLLMAGVTNARDVAGPLEESIWIKNEIDEGRLVGPRLFVSGPFLQKSLPSGGGPNYDARHQAFFRWTVDGPEDARRKARKLIDAGVDLLKVIQLNQLTSEERLAIADEARKAGLHIAVHAGSTEEIRYAAEMGVGSIEHVGGRLRNTGYDDEAVRLMADNRISWVPTVIHNLLIDVVEEDPERLDNQQLKRDLPPDIYEDVRESFQFPSRLGYFFNDREEDRKYGSKVRQLYDAGVRIVVGTDSGTPMNFHYEATWQEMDLLVKYGIPPIKVISMATRYPALLYGAYQDLGTIEPGKLADIIIVNGNPLRHMSALQQNNVIYVIKGGIQYKGPDLP